MILVTGTTLALGLGAAIVWLVIQAAVRGKYAPGCLAAILAFFLLAGWLVHQFLGPCPGDGEC